MKTCSKCGVEKDGEEFGRRRGRADGLQAYCKACSRAASAAYYEANPDKVREARAAYRAANPDKVRARSAAWSAANPEKVRAGHLRRTYGLTPEGYQALLGQQGGACAICGASECASGRSFAVDHDHTCCSGSKSCGKCVRGLLCGNCNLGIGKFSDNPETLLRAAQYLTKQTGA